MKNTTLILIGVLMFGLTNLALAGTITVDGTPLSSYTSLGEWNTPGDYEDWTVNNISGDAVVGGSLTGVFSSGDAQLGLTTLTSADPRYGASFVRTGTVIEVRIRFENGTAVNGMHNFDLIAGSGLRTPPTAWNSIQTDGDWHIYQLTLEDAGVDNVQMGFLRGMRFDPNWNTGIGEAFEIDYIRVGGYDDNPLTIDGAALIGYLSLGEWNTPGDFEGWECFNSTATNVTGGYITGVPATTDPQVRKEPVTPVGLSTSNYLEVRMRLLDTTSPNDPHVLWTTDVKPTWDGNNQVWIPDFKLKHDGDWHVYRYDMSAKPFWAGELKDLRFDPYDINASSAYEIDYIRTGDTLIPEPATLGLLCVLGLAFLRRK